MRQSSMDYWWPIIEFSGQRVPATRKLQLKEGLNLREYMDGWPTKSNDLFDEDTCNYLGLDAEFPAFLRSDQMASKHEWKDTCYVKSNTDILRHTHRIADTVYMSDLTVQSFYLRELIPTESAFRAFHGDMPITTEARTFLRDGKVDCIHPYWPAESIRQWAEPWRAFEEYEKQMLEVGGPPMAEEHRKKKGPDNWEWLLAGQHATITRELDNIKREAGKLAKFLVDKTPISYWSADYLLDTSGKWWLTDMACGIESFHWEGCEKAVSIMDCTDESDKLLAEGRTE